MGAKRNFAAGGTAAQKAVNAAQPTQPIAPKVVAPAASKKPGTLSKMWSTFQRREAMRRGQGTNKIRGLSPARNAKSLVGGAL